MTETISSLQNPRVLAARKLRRRSQRDEARAYLLEGSAPLREALAAGVPLHEVFVSDDEALAAEAEAAGARVVRVTTSVIEALSETATPQGAVAVLGMEDVAVGDLPEAADLVLVLDQIRDPGNAGTLVRCAAAAGAAAVFFTTGSVDPYSPKTVRASAGAMFRVGLGRGVDLAGLVRELDDRGFLVVGAEANGPTPYDSLDYSGRVAFVVGNEAWGITGEHRALLAEVVSIPMPGPAESLNAGIAGAILLFEAVRQRRISSAAT
jgi:TrmH family RNA methyltransferase